MIKKIGFEIKRLVAFCSWKLEWVTHSSIFQLLDTHETALVREQSHVGIMHRRLPRSRPP